MSRTLARLRSATGDPLLVRAGRGLVATPRAAALHERAAELVQQAKTVLSPAAEIDIAGLERTFTLRTGEGFVENYGPGLLQRIASEAPRVRLRFLDKSTRDSGPLREGAVDLELGVIGKATSPEVLAKALFRDRFVGVVRLDHPLATGRVSAARYAKAKHVDVVQHAPGPVDAALAQRGFAREISVIVSGFVSALALARASDYVATVPERYTDRLRTGLFAFALPCPVPPFTISLLWHPRLDADFAHRWLRRCVEQVCAERSLRGTTKTTRLARSGARSDEPPEAESSRKS